uniref:HSA-B protein n=1 Tax=Mus musculus TaxID=10090 RepID=Q8K1U5_MOUSE|nr:HSA-B [Mus musculus]
MEQTWAELGLGLLLPALLLPTQIQCNQISVAPVSSNQNISASPNPSNATTRVGGSSPQSTAGLLAHTLSLFYISTVRDSGQEMFLLPIF